MIRYFRNYYFYLGLAVIIGGLLRFWRLGDLPYPPNLDELSFGYYGWSILHFGTDEFGGKFPLYFPSIGDYKYPLLAYLNILPAFIFGLTDFSVRFWSAAAGTLLIILVYILSNVLFQSKKIALIAAFFIALTPWSITLSRLGYETNVAVSITTLGILLLLEGFKRKNNIWFFDTSFFCFVLSMYCYSAQRIFISSFLLGLFLVSFFSRNSLIKQRKVVGLFFITLLAFGLLSFIPWESRARAGSVASNKLSPEQVTHLAESYIEAGTSPVHIPPKLTYLFHNQYQIALFDTIKRYFDYFSPEFLFFVGDRGPEKIPEVGELLHILILFLPLGFLGIFNEKKYREIGFILVVWLLTAPLAASLTFGGPYNTRSSMMMVPLVLVSAFGFYWSIQLFHNQKMRIGFLSFFILAFFVNAAFFFNQLFVHKPVAKPWVSEQGNREMVQEVYRLKDHYKAVAIADDEYIFFLFYNKILPEQFNKNATIIPAKVEDHWKRVDRFENIYFKMPFECPRSGKLGVLYICNGVNIPQNAKVISVFRFLDSVPAYTLVEFYPISQMPKTLPLLPEGLKYMVDIETDPRFPDGIIPDTHLTLW